jgi:hypothetical protein
VGCEGRIQARDSDDGRLLWDREFEGDVVQQFSEAAGGGKVLATGRFGRSAVLSALDGALIWQRKDQNHHSPVGVILPGAEVVAIGGGDDGRIVFYDLASGGGESVLLGNVPINRLALSANQRSIVASDLLGVVHVIDLASRRAAARFETGGDWFEDSIVTPDLSEVVARTRHDNVLSIDLRLNTALQEACTLASYHLDIWAEVQRRCPQRDAGSGQRRDRLARGQPQTTPATVGP